MKYSIIITLFLIMMFIETVLPNDILHPKSRPSVLSNYTTQLLNSTITLKILLVEFSDVKHRTSPSAYTKTNFENLFGSNGIYVTPNMYSPDSENIYGSLQDYYQKMSNGNLTVTGSVINNVNNNIPIWISLPNTKTFYAGIHTDTLIAHAKSAATANGLNISGLSDYVKLVIIYAGNIHFNDYLNPCADHIPGTLYIMSERNGTPTNHENGTLDKFGRIGVHCHEFAHTIGIGHSTASRADIMCAGYRNGPDPGGDNGAAPAPLSPFARILMGWSTQRLIYGSATTSYAYYSLTVPTVFRINSNNAYGDYFIIENRRFNQNMVIGTTIIPDYNNVEFMPIARSQNSTNVTYTQGILVWRYTGKYGQIYDYTNTGLIYASGRYGASYPDNLPTETDAGDIFPGTSGATILSPWSDSRDPYAEEPDPFKPNETHWTLYVPNTQSGTNAGMEILSENIPDGYFNLRLYPSQQLLSSTISSNQTLNGEYICSGNVTINSGVTVNISAGSTLVFQNGVSLTNNGVLNVNGTLSQPVTFTSQKGNSQNSWSSLVLNGAGANSSNLNYLNMQFGTRLNINNTTNITVQNSSILNCTDGIVGSTATASILYNKIKNINTHGISLTNCAFTCKYNIITKSSDFPYYHVGYGILYNGGSSGIIYQNDIRGFSSGIGALWGSSPNSNGPNDNIRNNRITNCNVGITAYASSNPSFGTNPNSGGRWNSFYSNTLNASIGVTNTN